MSLTDNVHNDFDGNHTGLGAYGELGRRDSRAPTDTDLAFAARLDAPFYSLANNDRLDGAPTAGSGGVVAAAASTSRTMYYAPLSLEVASDVLTAASARRVRTAGARESDDRKGRRRSRRTRGQTLFSRSLPCGALLFSCARSPGAQAFFRFSSAKSQLARLLRNVSMYLGRAFR